MTNSLEIAKRMGRSNVSLQKKGLIPKGYRLTWKTGNYDMKVYTDEEIDPFGLNLGTGGNDNMESTDYGYHIWGWAQPGEDEPVKYQDGFEVPRFKKIEVVETARESDFYANGQKLYTGHSFTYLPFMALLPLGGRTLLSIRYLLTGKPFHKE